jgi:hypothetical protein
MPKDSTTTGAATASAVFNPAEGRIRVNMPYTDDFNGNNTYTVRYKKSSDTEWTPWVTEDTHQDTPYITTITGRLFETDYDVEMTYNDTDTVNGAPTQYAYDVTTLSDDFGTPAAVSDLATSTAGSDTITLTWTAPGDEPSPWDTGTTAASYDIRYANAPITNQSTWDAAITVDGEPSPSVQGTAESHTVTLPESNTIYYFAIRTTDDVPNVSDLSNSPSGKTGLLLGWNIVSCPKTPNPNDTDSVFADDANYDYMLYYNSTYTGVFPYDDPDTAYEWLLASTIEYGKGLFLWSASNTNPTDAEGTENAVGSYTLTLKPGWNLIGNPYETNVALSACSVTNGATVTYSVAVNEPNEWIGNAAYSWNGSTYDPSAILEPWKGYWILNSTDPVSDIDLIIFKP